MVDQHIEPLGHRVPSGVDERDVVLQVTHRHTGQQNPGKEHRSPNRFGVVDVMTVAVAGHLDQPGPHVLAQRVG
ncbi:hypothetical protein [Nonomuraea dietziae]|uniref:Uncharacterized protein n=1 Tax=Nonomuraea dietziae TaxID=65515 RepID=A0A7W5V5I0_9ACTN|nr:hypothetical protein [Nonomuraea dietziae]MBB3725235.1 hypothetical protein [Nonomuraea dietziae]